MKNRVGTRFGIVGAAIAMGAMALAGGQASAVEAPEGWEKCYGISKAGENDGMAPGQPNADVPGMSTKDYDGMAWRMVKRGTCSAIETPYGTGSLQPIPGRPPKG